MTKKLLVNKVFLVAKHLCETLFAHGYTAYFAGGYVRDLFLHQTSDEIDIATSASPEAVEKLFSKTIAVGKQFGVILVIEEGMQFEVTTFRKDHASIDGRHPIAVDFSTAEKDAQRRDFTINGMFYDPLTQKILDYVGGEKDIQAKIIRAIGEPCQRFQEDRLRMIRAVRFAARFSFSLEEKTAEAIKNEARLLFPSVSKERIWQELNKMAHYPHFEKALLQLQELGLLTTIFPTLEGISIDSLVSSFPYFPLHCPTIAYLLQLFPHSSLDERLELCRYLKLSHEEMKVILFFDEADHLFKNKDAEPFAWALFYAHEKAELYLAIAKAKLSLQERLLFIKEDEERKKQLAPHIRRIQNGTPLVRSADLKAKGITPGKQMGELLEKARRLSVNEDLHTKEEVVARLFE